MKMLPSTKQPSANELKCAKKMMQTATHSMSAGPKNRKMLDTSCDAASVPRSMERITLPVFLVKCQFKDSSCKCSNVCAASWMYACCFTLRNTNPCASLKNTDPNRKAQKMPILVAATPKLLPSTNALVPYEM